MELLYIISFEIVFAQSAIFFVNLIISLLDIIFRNKQFFPESVHSQYLNDPIQL